MPVELQRILVQLQSDLEPTRERGVKAAAGLERDAMGELLPALIAAAMSDLDGPAGKAFVALAARHEGVAKALFGELDKLSEREATPNLVLSMRTKFQNDERLQPLLNRWHAKGSASAQRAAARALERRPKGDQ